MGDKVRLADIAEKTGVSIVSVSKALSGKGGVSRQKLEEIKKVAKELGYEPHTYAARHPSKNIGVICRESYLTRFYSFYWQMYQDMNKTASLMGSFAMLEVVTSDMENKTEMPRLLAEDKVDACIVVGNMAEDYLSAMREGFDIPVVYLDFMGKDADMDCVVSDSFYGAYAMTNYLYDMGHTKIAYVGTLLATGSITDRYLGYQKSVLEHGGKLKKEWIIDDRDAKTGLTDAEKMLTLPKDMPTAFFCNCDLTAALLIKKLEKNGYHVPEDISVAGYDNYTYPGICETEITTYEVDLAEMSKQAVEIALQNVWGEDYKKGLHIVCGKLVEKESVKKLHS
ncbi:MAG: LacI family DNA-binding transcriptional regulator [Lachnospiraceae bacterium]|nr:LacI family DNA-binding transcriptional regulator [Lachnospiraceae bacterium]